MYNNLDHRLQAPTDSKRKELIMSEFIIRNEQPEDYQTVEEITRKAFYNMYIPGCVEHYLVHMMRDHEDFIPELAFVIELNGKLIGNIMYTKAELTDEKGTKKEILTFGPVSILPEYQRKGYGKRLIQHSLRAAASMSYDTVVIFGSPANYVSLGFVSCKKFNICTENSQFPAAMMVCPLTSDALDGRKWFYRDSPVMGISERDAAAYDATLPPMEKIHQPSQEEFYILSQAFIQ